MSFSGLNPISGILVLRSGASGPSHLKVTVLVTLFLMPLYEN
jgi:hypothetical protein